MTTFHWNTEISYTTEDEIRIRGYSLPEMMGKVPFASAVHLMIVGELPSKQVAKLIDALMVAAIDHGAGTPSVLAARTAASGGASVKDAATAGFLSLDKSHGAAVESSMDAISVIKSVISPFICSDEKRSELKKYLQSERAAGRKIIPGFGHRQHSRDPRVKILFDYAAEASLADGFIDTATLISDVLTEIVGKQIPINIDGAMAAILLELHYPKDLGNALFLISRLTSLLVHAHEEVSTMPRMRRIDPVNIGFSGTPDRELPHADMLK